MSTASPLPPALPDRALIESQVRAALTEAEAEAKEKRTWLRRSYRPVLRSSQRHPVITLCIAVAILVASGALIPLLKINLLGNTGQNMVSLSQQVPAGTSTDSMVERAATSEKALENVAGVESVATMLSPSIAGCNRL